MDPMATGHEPEPLVLGENQEKVGHGKKVKLVGTRVLVEPLEVVVFVCVCVFKPGKFLGDL